MKVSTWSIPISVIVPAVLILETAFCAMLAAAILDVFVRRPQVGGGSVTTLLPGLVYASATVMKVCLVSGLASAAAAVAWRLFAPGPSRPANSGLPSWGIASIALAPSTPLLGAVAVLIAQSLDSTPDALSPSHFSQESRSAVFVMLAIVSAGALASVASLARRERPVPLPILGLAVNLIFIGLFWHLRFYALGFDQDRWAPR